MKNLHEFVINYIGDAAHKFNVYADSSVTDETMLEKIFAWFNHGSGKECPKFIEKKMRSLSVNDCVRLNSQWYQCRSVGWEKVTEEFVDELEASVVAHPRYVKEGGWACLQDIMWSQYKRIS